MTFATGSFLTNSNGTSFARGTCAAAIEQSPAKSNINPVYFIVDSDAMRASFGNKKDKGPAFPQGRFLVDC
jgi:hypothetical protein